MNYFLDCFTKKYADFEGRAPRAEYWFFVLFLYVALFVVVIVDVLVIAVVGIPFPIFILTFLLVSIIPHLAVTVRRLHDTGKPGVWILLAIIPCVNSIGGIVIFIFMLLESEPGRNQYGPNPYGVGGRRRSRSRGDDYDDYDEYEDRPRRSRASSYDEDDDDRPRRSRRQVEYDDDDDDDDYDPPPRRRGPRR